jgi:hypothetical protein
LSEDPIGFAARDANLYRYVGNSPTNYTDPQGKDLYDILNRSDQFAAGFGDAVTFGGTTWLREKAYGEQATKNHQGGWFTAGQVTGAGASLALGYGAEAQAAKLAPGLVKAVRFYDATGAVVDSYNGIKNIASGCSNWTDWLGLAPGVGALAGRAGKGFNGLDDVDIGLDDLRYSFRRDNTFGNDNFIYDLKDLGNKILSDPFTNKVYQRITNQGTDVIIDHGIPPTSKTFGEYDPFKNTITIYDQNNLNIKDAISTLIHESVHVEQRAKGFRNSIYEEYMAFRRELFYQKEQRRPSLEERKDLWKTINEIPEYQTLDERKNPFGGGI